MVEQNDIIKQTACKAVDEVGKEVKKSTQEIAKVLFDKSLIILSEKLDSGMEFLKKKINNIGKGKLK